MDKYEFTGRTKETELQKGKNQDVSFNRGICEGLEIAQGILLKQQKL